MRVFNTVEHNEKTMFGFSTVQKHIDISVLLPGGDRYDALVRIRVGGSVQFFSLQEPDLNTACPASVDDALHSLVVPLARDPDVVEAPGTGLQRFTDRMDAEDDDHRLTVYDSAGRGFAC